MTPITPALAHGEHAAAPTETPPGDPLRLADTGPEPSSTMAAAADEAPLAYPEGFSEQVVFSGLDYPTMARFASDGRVFVAEKRGTVQVFSSLTDGTPTQLINLDAANNDYPSGNVVYDYWDRGFLGMALHPAFPATPYLYVLYTANPHAYTDGNCPLGQGTQPGGGCMAEARLERIEVSASNTVVSRTRLIGADRTAPTDQWLWCVQYPSHTIGHLDFGADGMLYASGGDGASFNFADYGQGGTNGTPTPKNPCGDPPVPVGGDQQPTTGQGGALRSQDLRTAGDHVTYDGAILRLDPITGAAATGNPLLGGDTLDDRIVAYGLRNPFRFTFRPGTSDLYVGDVGWGEWEEINRRPTQTAPVTNFGWPCYEGTARQSGYDALNNGICVTLYSAGGVTGPLLAYPHNAWEGCTPATSATSGLAFYEGGDYPDEFDGALFFADYAKGCLFYMTHGGDGIPDAASATLFNNAVSAVGLEIGPEGDLFYVDLLAGAIKRIVFTGGNQPPVAAISSVPSPPQGPPPLTVDFNGSASSDPDGDTLTFAWDLDGDGQFDDSTVANPPPRTYSTPGPVVVQLRVADPQGAEDVAEVTVMVGSPPVADIITPTSSFTWKVGDAINFEGDATDSDGPLPESSFSWDLRIHHCAADDPSDCHVHLDIGHDTGREGSFSAPDHEYPSHLELILTVTDPSGLSDTVSLMLQPQTVVLTFDTEPDGLRLNAAGISQVAPFTRTVIKRSAVQIAALSPQTVGSHTYAFDQWDHGGAATQTITAPDTAATYRARYTASNRLPIARLAAVPKRGSAPLNVTFDASSSSDPDGDSLTFAWDLDNDGAFDDASGAVQQKAFSSPGRFTVRVKVSDGWGGAATRSTQINVVAPQSPPPSPAPVFLDVPKSHTFHDDIIWLAIEEITLGCNAEGTLYCPESPVTRGQMAAFLVRFLGLTDSGSGDFFSDDDDSIFEEDIDKLAHAGITLGCADGLYCPEDSVTRGQMAAFLARALDLPAAPSAGFDDTAGSVFEGAINRLAAAGITQGCTADLFCPLDFVTRGQMAAFLHRGESFR